jgi:CheY-like chemotaxis protein
MFFNDILDRPELAPESSATRPSLLIVDDDEAMVEVLARRLHQQGFDTVVAQSGTAALALARSQRPALILLDLRLPDRDGFSVCQQLVDSPETCHIPVIILSGMERPDIIRRCRAAGCDYFVRKPYDPNALLVLIRQALHERKAWADPEL